MVAENRVSVEIICGFGNHVHYPQIHNRSRKIEFGTCGKEKLFIKCFIQSNSYNSANYSVVSKLCLWVVHRQYQIKMYRIVNGFFLLLYVILLFPFVMSRHMFYQKTLSTTIIIKIKIIIMIIIINCQKNVHTPSILKKFISLLIFFSRRRQIITSSLKRKALTSRHIFFDALQLQFAVSLSVIVKYHTYHILQTNVKIIKEQMNQIHWC